MASQIIYDEKTGSVESTLKEFKNLSDKIEITLDSFIGAGYIEKTKLLENILQCRKECG